MAKLSWSVQGSIGSRTTDGPVVTDLQLDRFLDWVWFAYPQLNPDGTTKTKNNANLAAAFDDWVESQWQGTKANVLNYERTLAEQAASDAVTDIA